MNSFNISIFAGLGGLCLALSSCGEMNKPLAGGGGLMDPGMNAAGFGGVTPGGFSADMRPEFHLSHVAEATAEQRRSAELSAKEALESSSVVNQVREKKVQYVAVPVKRSKTQKESGTPVMKVNVATGVSTGEIFIAAEGGPKNGDKLKLGGDSTLYLALTGDKL